MFHVPAHKNVTAPAAQTSPEPRPVAHEPYYCGTKVREQQRCTCGPVRHWECNAGCKAAMINNALAAQRHEERRRPYDHDRALAADDYGDPDDIDRAF